MKISKRPSSALRRLAYALRAPRPALSVEGLAALWASKNYDTIAAISRRSLREAPGTSYRVHPISFIVFASEAARNAYAARLFREAKLRKPTRLADEVLCLHTTELTTWCRQQVFDSLAGLAIEGTYKAEQSL